MDEKTEFIVINRATGSRFGVGPGETVLAAARRQDIHLSYSCTNGTCASCQATVVEGDWHYPYLPPVALSEEEQRANQALTCQCVPLSDMTIIAREPQALRDIETRTLAVRVSAVEPLAPDVMRVCLKLPRGETLKYLGGQYLEFLLPEGRRRAFSIASAPETGGDLELHIRQVPGGDFTDFVFHELRVGKVLRMEAPLGSFFLRDQSERPIICVAGGTGFAPIKAIVEHYFAIDSERPLHLYWGARGRKDLYLHELAAGWAAEHEQVQYTPVLSEADADWSGRTGLVHRAVLEDHPELSGFDVYAGGPPPLIDALRHEFAEHGLPTGHLYYDSFEFAPDILAKMAGVV